MAGTYAYLRANKTNEQVSGHCMQISQMYTLDLKHQTTNESNGVWLKEKAIHNAISSPQPAERLHCACVKNYPAALSQMVKNKSVLLSECGSQSFPLWSLQ